MRFWRIPSYLFVNNLQLLAYVEFLLPAIPRCINDIQPTIVGRHDKLLNLLPRRLAIFARCAAEQQPVCYVVCFVESTAKAGIPGFQKFAMPANHSQAQPPLLGYNEFRLFPLQISLFELSHHLQCGNGTLVALVAQAATAALLCLQQVVCGYEAEYHGHVILHIQFR